MLWNGIKWMELDLSGTKCCAPSNYIPVQIVPSSWMKKILDWFSQTSSSKWWSKHFLLSHIFLVSNPKLNLNQKRMLLSISDIFLSFTKMGFRLKVARRRFSIMQILSIFFFSFKIRRKKYFLDFRREKISLKENYNLI